jgi:hypothetical protein
MTVRSEGTTLDRYADSEERDGARTTLGKIERKAKMINIIKREISDE